MDLARRRCHSATSPLDLVLGGVKYDASDDIFDMTLRDAFQDHAAKDAIRRVHPWSGNATFLNSIISPLVVAGQGVRPNGMGSFGLWNDGNMPVDVSDFFANYRSPKLRRLEVFICGTAS